MPPVTQRTSGLPEALLERGVDPNAHHPGQVIVVRQLLGAWPPPAGSWMW